MKPKILARDKFFSDYLKALRKNVTIMVKDEEAREFCIDRISAILNDFRQNLQYNGINFIQNEPSTKARICTKCKKKINIGITQNYTNPLCLKCAEEVINAHKI